MGNCFIASLSMDSSSAASDSNSASQMASPPFPKKRRLSSPPSSLLPPSLSSGHDLRLHFDLGPVLGRGQFGTIRLCTHLSSCLQFACKSIPKLSCSSSPRLIQDVISEIRIMQLLPDHPHIVQLHHVFEDKAYVHLVMELCSGGELFDRIVAKGSYPERDAARIIKSLVETISFCHSMGVMHRDLKPENILLADSSDSSDIKLADFGLALRFSPGQKFSGMAGSAYYIAPEVLQGRYSEEIDIWSAGVILYILLSGVPPFWGETEDDIFKAIKEGKLEFPDDPWCKVSSSAKDLIKRMLCSEVASRLTPAQILEHPWILHHAPMKQQRASQEPQSSDEFERSTAAELDFQELLQAITTEINKDPLLSSDILAQVRLPEGCTCTLLDSREKEQKFLIQTKQGKFLVVNDKLRKQIGWKPLELQDYHPGNSKILPSCTATTNGPLFHQSQIVC